MADDISSVLRIDGLSFSYDEKPLLRINQFDVSARERVAVLGPSGCGKTTFVHLIAGLLRSQAGTILIKDQDIGSLGEEEMDRIRGQYIGIVFQRLHLVPSVSVLENLMLAQRLARCPLDRAYALELLNLLGLQDLQNQMPSNLSQGQAQRVAVARAVVHRPLLLVADEPTSALDDFNAKEAIEVLCNVTDTNDAALIVVTHDDRVRGRMDRTFELGSPA